MKNKLPYLWIFFLVLITISSVVVYDYYHVTSKEYVSMIANHPLNKNAGGAPKKNKGGEVPPNAYFNREHLLEMNPVTGEVHPENLEKIKKQNSSKTRFSQAFSNTDELVWEERGPDNIGGRTRVVFYDPNDATGKRVFAGGVSGGLWVNNDITNQNSLWTQVGIDDNLAVSCYAIDPNDSNTWYIGTGESYTSNDGAGNGLWRTTNGGSTWSQVVSIDFSEGETSRLYYINQIVAWNNAGTTELFLSVDGAIDYESIGHQSSGWYRLNGETFSKINFRTLNNTPYVFSDVEIATDNSIWLATKNNRWGSGGGKIFRSTDGVNFTEKYAFTNGKRVELSVSKKTNNIVYALAEVPTGVELVKTTNGNSFSQISKPNDLDDNITADDFCRRQAFYNLMLEVDPNNDDIVYAGGINLFRSADGGTNWNQMSKWVNASGALRNLNVSLVHVDQHALAFDPNNSNAGVFGNDGGIYYSSSLSSTISSGNTIASRNRNYNVTQLYSVAIGQDKDNEIILGGAQDNGSPFVANAQVGINSYSDIFGGDGIEAFVDKDGQYAILSYVNNVYTTQPLPFVSFRDQIEIVYDTESGFFANEADLDDNLDILYTDGSLGSFERISRYTNLTGTPVRKNFSNTTLLKNRPTAIKVSPYTTNSSTVFIGTTGGDVLKVTNFNTDSPTWANVDINNKINTGAISDIAFGSNENEILITLHNYGVHNIYYTTDGGLNWTAKDGDFPDVPTKAIIMNPNDKNEVLIGTNLGVWRTLNFTSSSPNWVQSKNGMSSVKVTKFDFRTSDNTVAAATYGRGFYTTKFTDNNLIIPTIPKEEVYINALVQNKILTIELNSVTTLADVKIYNVNGGLVLSQGLDFSNTSVQNINTPLQPGIYILNMSYAGNQISKKIMVIN